MVTGGYKRLQGIVGLGTRDRGLQGVTGGYGG